MAGSRTSRVLSVIIGLVGVVMIVAGVITWVVVTDA